MALNSYEIEIKNYIIEGEAGIIEGVVLSVSKYSVVYSRGDIVIAFVPMKNLQIVELEDSKIAFIAEEHLLLKPKELNFDRCVNKIQSVFRTLNALHYSLSVLQNDVILIVGSPDSVPILVSCYLNLTVFYAGKEDFKVKNAKYIEAPDAILSETGGLGVNYVLDFHTSHSFTLKKSIIDCLAIRSKWAVCDPDLQLDPPESQQLYMRNSSLCFFNENVWLFSGTDHGKFLHLLSISLKYLQDYPELRKSS